MICSPTTTFLHHGPIWALTGLSDCRAMVCIFSVMGLRCSGILCPWLSLVYQSALDQHRWPDTGLCIHKHMYIFASSQKAGVRNPAHLGPWLSLSERSHLQLLRRLPTNSGCYLTLTGVCKTTRRCFLSKSRREGKVEWRWISYRQKCEWKDKKWESQVVVCWSKFSERMKFWGD